MGFIAAPISLSLFKNKKIKETEFFFKARRHFYNDFNMVYFLSIILNKRQLLLALVENNSK